MKTLLVFIPERFHHEKPGYMFGKVVYDPKSETRKFYIVGVRNNVKSNNDLIGYFTGSNNIYRYLDKMQPDWINIYLCPTKIPSGVSYDYCVRDLTVDNRKVTSSLHQTVVIVYDQLSLMEAELLENRAPQGEHFQELKLILHGKAIEDEIKSKSRLTYVKEILLTYHMLFFLYQVQFFCRITNKLLPVLKYSALGLHLNGWLENAKWMLVTVIQNKRFTLKTTNYFLATALDVMMGILLLRFVFQNIGDMPPSQILLDNAERVVDTLKELVDWLMGAPAGLKLNHSFNGMLGRFFLYHVNLWWTFLQVTKPILEFAFKVLLLFGKLGVTFQISIAADLLALVSFHSYCIYVYAARLFNMQLCGLTALFRLFLGKKKNPLRDRVDSCQYQPDQLFIGTLVFTILLFLMPTTWVYYSVFTTLRLILIGLGGFFTRLRFYLQVMPVYVFFKWIIGSPITSSSMKMRMHTRNGEGPTTLVVTTVVCPWDETWCRCIPNTIKIHPSVEWSKIVNNVFWGELLYPL